MAAYTDQFERRSPFKILPGFHFGGRLSVAIDQATEVLVERGKDEVVRIAECVSRAIDAEAVDYGRWHTEHFADVYPDFSAADLAVVREGAVGDLAEQIREEIGELGLFMGIEPALTRQDGQGGEVAFERPEALAVLSLWLAVDCIDLVISEAGDTFDRWVGSKRYGAEAAVLAMDAMSASILSVEARERAVDREQVAAAGARADVIAEMVEREEVLRRDRSARGRKASDARWAPKDEHVAKALEIARAKPFAKWVDAARAIQAEITKTPDGTDVYTETTIIGWLKDAGLTRTKNR